ncbi:GDP-mannose 4,6-dehydratase [Prochlorococcus sp. MIT 1300]|uniref:GDP-mannose 4,6-dehydratase n=1 Tax=Prochlorococcus sp. MIT 1300 TaxID=3096218 RepID=UPI002A762153|nr:GDP-mannose 4,6-dehydratase [Prochlorococcus sp. MIT 1300]
MTQDKILVIGSNSFSGSHFVNHALQQNYKVWGVSRSNEPSDPFLAYKWEKNNLTRFTFDQYNINTDITELIDKIKVVKPNFIVNFAAQGMVAESWSNPQHWYQTNLVSQVMLHDELRKMSFLQKYVHVTTPEVYGSTENGWIKENNHFNPSTPYAVSRAACDMHLMSFFKTYEFPVVFTRSANVYGPGQQLYRIIPKTILSAKSKKKMRLHGGGSSERSFIHIKDVVDGTLKIMLQASPGSSWHLSTKKKISIKELVFKICSISGVKPNEIVEVEAERLGKDQSYLLDSETARSKLNWSDKISLDQGILETMAWIDNNFEQLSNEPWEYIHKS